MLSVRARVDLTPNPVARALEERTRAGRRHLDLTVSKDIGKHVQVKLNCVNLLSSDTVVTLGPENRDDRVMRVHSVPQGLDNTFYDDARVFTVSGTYTY